jgi:hypothetical protein
MQPNDNWTNLWLLVKHNWIRTFIYSGHQWPITDGEQMMNAKYFYNSWIKKENELILSSHNDLSPF